MDIFLAVIVTILVLVIEHLLRRVRGKPFHPLAAYTMGGAALFAPMCALFMLWGNWHAFIAAVAIAACGGATVFLCYLFFDLHDAKTSVKEEREINRMLRQ